MADKRVLIVYYSYEGNTRFIAETIAKEVGGELLELKVKNDITSKGFMKYFWGGRQVVFREKPELLPFDRDPASYDLIFIGTPVWAYTFAPALRSLFDKVMLKDKKVAVFCTHEGSMANTLDHMKAALKGNEIIGAKDFIMPLENKPVNEINVREWVSSLLSSVD